MAEPATENDLALPHVLRPNRSDFALDRKEMLRYLGHAGQEIDQELADRIERAAQRVVELAAPAATWRVFGIEHVLDAQGRPAIGLTGSTVRLAGSDIWRHLKDADACALMAVTIGAGVEREIRRVGALNGLDGALLDAAGSAYAESLAEHVDGIIRARAAQAGLTGNWRFSCGYGDCPLDAQPDILASLNAGRTCGLTVTSTNLLLPSKSVTATIGLFSGEVRAATDKPSCSMCRQKGACAFRARGTTCF